MSTTTARKLEQIRRYSISLRRLARFLFVVTLLGAAVSLLFILFRPDRWAGPMDVIGIRFTGFALDGTVRAFAALTVVLSAGVVAKFFFHAIKLFGLYAQGVYFTAESVAQIRQLGITLLLIPAAWLVGPAAVLILSSSAPTEGGLSLVSALLILGPDTTAEAGVALVSAPTGQLVSGIIVIFVSWIMDLARELREEQELVV